MIDVIRPFLIIGTGLLWGRLGRSVLGLNAPLQDHVLWVLMLPALILTGAAMFRPRSISRD